MVTGETWLILQIDNLTNYTHPFKKEGYAIVLRHGSDDEYKIASRSRLTKK